MPGDPSSPVQSLPRLESFCSLSKVQGHLLQQYQEEEDHKKVEN